MPAETTHAYPAWTTVRSAAVKNNGATVMNGGNISSSARFPNVTQALGTATMNFRSGVNGGIVPGPFTVLSAPGHRCTTYALSNGTFATMTAGRYIMRRYTNYIAGVASSVLNSGCSNFGRRPYPAASGLVRTRKYILTGGWVYQTGRAVNKGFGTDAAGREAFPTYALPGRITYAYMPPRDASSSSTDGINSGAYAAKTD